MAPSKIQMARLRENNMEKVTIKDIAQALHLSVGTVYRSLNNTGRVSDRTRGLVLDYAERVGFQPNTVAQGLAKRKKYRIVILLSRDYDEWWSRVLEGFEKAAQELSEFGVETTILRCSGPFPDRGEEIGLLRLLKTERVDGIILAPTIHPEVTASLEYAREHGIDAVCVNADAQLPTQRLFYYGPDEERVGRMAGELLGKFMRGRGKACLVGVESTDHYRLALRKKGLFNQLDRCYPEIDVAQSYSFPRNQLRGYLAEMLRENRAALGGIYVYDAVALREQAFLFDKFTYFFRKHGVSFSESQT